jgi:hypothetical protein
VRRGKGLVTIAAIKDYFPLVLAMNIPNLLAHLFLDAL